MVKVVGSVVIRMSLLTATGAEVLFSSVCAAPFTLILVTLMPGMEPFASGRMSATTEKMLWPLFNATLVATSSSPSAGAVAKAPSAVIFVPL